MRNLRVTTVVATFALIACGGSAPTMASGSIAISNGTADNGDPAVGALTDAHCSGSLIAANKVLTAAHCTGASTVGSTVQFGNVSATVSAYAAHPLFDPNSQTDLNNIHDLAVLTLASSLSITPLSLNAAAPTAGEGIRIVGFGATDASGNGTDFGDKHQTDQKISAVGTAAFDYFATGTCPGMTQNGDSGGPDLAPSNGGWAIAGVVNWGSPTSGVDTRVDAHRDWIQQQ